MRKVDNLPPYCAVVKNSRSLNFLDPSGTAWPVTGVLYLYLFTIFITKSSLLRKIMPYLSFINIGWILYYADNFIQD